MRMKIIGRGLLDIWLLDAVQVVSFNNKKIKDLVKKDIKDIKILDENDFHLTSKYFEFFNYLRFSQLFHDQIFSSCISYCYKANLILKNIERVLLRKMLLNL